jgi:Dockerin type I domain/Pregnancy-associated plasma protein-A
MKMIKFLPVAAILLIVHFSTITHAQNFDCGTVITPEQVEIELQRYATIQQAMLERSDYIIDVPIAIHILRQSDGSGGLNPADLDGIFDSANVLLVPGDLHFFQYGSTDFIDDDDLYFNMDQSYNYDILRQTNTVPEAVNIYFVENTEISGFAYCGLSSFSSSTVQGIIMNNHCADVTINKSTFTHEIGHYFDLYHTHETAFDEECPSGSNCDVAGDLICDTPADPQLYDGDVYHVSEYPDCEYDNFFSTPLSCDMTPYDPQTENLMSYSRKLCRDIFTSMQFTKFRTVAETIRTELLLGIEGFLVNPRYLFDEYVIIGNEYQGNIDITWFGEGSVDITSVTTQLGIVTVTDIFPVTIPQNTTQAIAISISDSYTTDICTIDRIIDTILISTSSIDLPLISVPVTVDVVYSIPTSDENIFGSECLKINVPNTPGIGNGKDSAFIQSDMNILYDGSLLLGLVDNGDTVVHMDFVSQRDFKVADTYLTGFDEFGRQTKTLKFITTDNKIHGEVKYIFGKSNPEIDSCTYIIVEYTLENPCDTNLTVYPGMVCDFDLDNNSEDSGWVDSSDLIVIAEKPFSNKSCALAQQYNCNGMPTLRILENQETIWPYGELPDSIAYRELTAVENSATAGRYDISLLLSFGETELNQGEKQVFRALMIYSLNFSSSIPSIYDEITSFGIGPDFDIDADCVDDSIDNCPDKYNPDQIDNNGNDIGDACEYICGDSSGDEIVNVSDAVWIINYVFVGGDPPSPLESGDVNCDGTCNVSDAVWIINYVFVGGNEPCDENGDMVPDC